MSELLRSCVSRFQREREWGGNRCGFKFGCDCTCGKNLITWEGEFSTSAKTGLVLYLLAKLHEQPCDFHFDALIHKERRFTFELGLRTTDIHCRKTQRHDVGNLQ